MIYTKRSVFEVFHASEVFVLNLSGQNERRRSRGMIGITTGGRSEMTDIITSAEGQPEPEANTNSITDCEWQSGKSLTEKILGPPEAPQAPTIGIVRVTRSSRYAWRSTTFSPVETVP